MPEARVPEVVGGIRLECVGGPFDGQWIFLPSGDSTVDVGHFWDDRRTPWVNGARPGAENYLGYYSPRLEGFVNGGSAVWQPFHNGIAEGVRASWRDRALTATPQEGRNGR